MIGKSHDLDHMTHQRYLPNMIICNLESDQHEEERVREKMAGGFSSFPPSTYFMQFWTIFTGKSL